MNYLNLAELQIISLDIDSALKTLQVLNEKSNLIPAGGADIDPREIRSLYYFYDIQCKIIKNINYDQEEAALGNIIKKYSTDRPLFVSWVFRTYNNWLKNNRTLDEGIRNKLMARLCLINPVSKDNLPCAVQ